MLDPRIDTRPAPRSVLAGGARTVLDAGRAALAGLMFVLFGIGACILSWVVLPIARLPGPTEAARIRRCQRIAAWGYVVFHALMRWMDLVHFDPRSLPEAQLTGPCVIVANHPTLVDVTAVLSVFRTVCMVVKSGLFRLIFLRPLLRSCWSIDAGDGGSMAGAAVIQGALARLEAGFPVLIFPEGTRSPAGNLGRFHRGAFEIACRAGVPVVPVYIQCDPPTLMKGLPWYALPKQVSHLRLEMLDPIAVEPFEGNASRLARHVESVYASRFRANSSDVHAPRRESSHGRPGPGTGSEAPDRQIPDP